MEADDERGTQVAACGLAELRASPEHHVLQASSSVAGGVWLSLPFWFGPHPPLWLLVVSWLVAGAFPVRTWWSILSLSRRVDPAIVREELSRAWTSLLVPPPELRRTHRWLFPLLFLSWCVFGTGFVLFGAALASAPS